MIYNDQFVFVVSFDIVIFGQNIELFEVKYWNGIVWNWIQIFGIVFIKYVKGYWLNGGFGLFLIYFNKDNSVFDDGVIILNLFVNQ